MTPLNFRLLDEIFDRYTMDKVNALAFNRLDERMPTNGPVTIFCGKDDDDYRVSDVVCVPVESNEELPRALITICLQLGPPDWVAILSDAYTMHFQPGEEHPGSLEPLFEAGDPRVKEELLMLAIHKNDDGIMVTRRYTNHSDYVDMEGVVWIGWPRNKRQGFLANLMTKFVDRYDVLEYQYAKLHPDEN